MVVSLNGQTQKPGPPVTTLLPVEQGWTVTLPATPLAAGVMDEDHVYVPVGPHAAEGVEQPATEQIVALNRGTGERRWSRALRSHWPPVVSGTTVLVATPEALHALDADSGLDRWRTALTNHAAGAPVLADHLLIVPIAREGLVAISTLDGAVVWRLPLDLGDRAPALLAHEGAIHASLDGGRLVRVSVRDGALLWEQRLAGELGPPAVARERVLVGSTDNHLYALEPDDGDFVWRYPAGGDVVGAAATADRIYFVARDNVLRALDRGSGNQRWKALLDTRAAAAPQVLDGVVLVHGFAPTLSAFDALTGAALGMYAAPSDLVGPALIDPKRRPFAVAIVAITGDGRVLGLRPVQMMFREPAVVPLPALPGRALDVEQAPARP